MIPAFLGLALFAWLKHKYGWDGAVLWIIPCYIAMNLASFVTFQGSLRRIKFLTALDRGLRDLPDDALLACVDKTVSLVYYDERENREKVEKLYTGGAVWRGGPRLTSKVKNSIRKARAIRTLIFVLFSVPLFVLTIWLGLTVQWIWLLAALLVVIDQFIMVVLLPQAWVHILEGVFDGR